MKRFLIYFVLLVASIWVGVLIHRDPGYILITYQHWSVETTLWFGILALLVFYVVLSLLLKILRGTISLSAKWHAWSEHRKMQKSNKFTFRGLCELAEGEWKNAEKDLLRGADHNETPLINYLAAANAAQRQNNFESRDNYLRLAHQHNPEAEMAIGLTQAQLQIAAQQWELALATLRHLLQLAPHHTLVLQLLIQVYIKLNDWQSLQELLPALRKQKILSDIELRQLEQQVYQHLLQNAINTAQAENYWQNLPKVWQNDAILLNIYIDYLIKINEPLKAETLVRDYLKKNWDERLVNSYGLIQGENLDKQLTIAEAWLKVHENDAILYLALGRICLRQKLWGKARDYFQTSIKLSPSPAAFRELGQLLEQLHEYEAATASYKQGLQFC